MFDIGIGFSEILLLAVIIIIVVGPEELPALLRSVGRFVGQLRRIADDFRSQLDEAIRETEIDKIKQPFDEVKDQVGDAVKTVSDPFGEDLIDFEEHNRRILDREKAETEAARQEADDMTGEAGFDDDTGSDGAEPHDAGKGAAGDPQAEQERPPQARKSGT